VCLKCYVDDYVEVLENQDGESSEEVKNQDDGDNFDQRIHAAEIEAEQEENREAEEEKKEVKDLPTQDLLFDLQ